MQHVPCCVCLFSLSTMPSGFLHLVSCVRIAFPFKKIFIFMYLFIWLLWVLVAADKIFSWGMQTLDCGILIDLVP